MTSEEQFRKDFGNCVDEMKKPIVDLATKYDTDVLISSLFEVGMRLSLLKYGTTGLMSLLGDVLQTMSTSGQMLDEMTEQMNKTQDAVGSAFLKTTNSKLKH
jgi:hypothetical protein